MRIIASFLAAFVAAALIGCSSGTSSGQSSSTEATTAPAASGASSTMSEMPMYPGAKEEASGSTGMTAGGMASGKVMSTADAFDKVYKWYQGKMPAGSEKSHMAAAGSNTAVFVMSATGGEQSTVTISTSAAMPGKTLITMAKVKK
jgi:hypothetical protein